MFGAPGAAGAPPPAAGSAASPFSFGKVAGAGGAPLGAAALFGSSPAFGASAFSTQPAKPLGGISLSSAPGGFFGQTGLASAAPAATPAQAATPGVGLAQSAEEELLRAAEDGDESAASDLLQRGAKAAVLDSRGNSALHWCAHNGMASALQLLVGTVADIDLANAVRGAAQRAPTTLQWVQCTRRIAADSPPHPRACATATRECCSRPQDGFTPLMLAAGDGWEQCVRTLLGAGAATDATSALGKSALAIALERQGDAAACGEAAESYAGVLDALGWTAPADAPPALGGKALELERQLADAAQEAAALRAELSKAHSRAEVKPAGLARSGRGFGPSPPRPPARVLTLPLVPACLCAPRPLASQESDAKLRALLAKAESASADARAESARLRSENRTLFAEVAALKRYEPMLDEAESSVQLLTAEVQRVELELEAATRRARVLGFASLSTQVGVATETEADAARDETPQWSAPAFSDLVTPLRQARLDSEQQTPASSVPGLPSGEAHRQAVGMGLAALEASPAKRPPLDALHRSGTKRSDLPSALRTPLGVRPAAGAGHAGPLAQLGAALLRLPS